MNDYRITCTASDPSFTLRTCPELREQLEQQALRNGRSLNTELNLRLVQSLQRSNGDTVAENRQ